MNIEGAFDEVSATVHSTGSVTDGMRALIAYCQRVNPSNVWDRILLLDFAADFAGVKGWLDDLLKSDPVPDPIKAYWFGVFECVEDDKPSYAIYISGSTEAYSEDDPDWACWQDDSYLPEGRYAPSSAIGDIYLAVQADPNVAAFGEYVLCLGYAALVVKRAMAELDLTVGGFAVVEPRDVVVGFDDGDSLHLGVVSADGWSPSTV